MKIIWIGLLLYTGVFAETSAEDLMVKMKVKNYIDGVTAAKVLVKNMMLTKRAAQARGVDQHFISRVTAQENHHIVFDLKTSEYISKNPIFKFKYKSTGGEFLMLHVLDNKSNKTSSRAEVRQGGSTSRVIGFEDNKESLVAYQSNTPLIQEMFKGAVIIDTEKVLLGAPTMASNANTVPINIYSEMKAKSITLFALEEKSEMKVICQWILNEQSIIDYAIKIKLNHDYTYSSRASIRIIIEGTDGKLYTVGKKVIIALGGGDG